MLISDRLIVSHAASALDASTESPQRFHWKRVLFLLYIKKRLLELGSRDRRVSFSLSDFFVQRRLPYRPYPWKILGYRSFRRSERETATYRLSVWLRTAGQWCW